MLKPAAMPPAASTELEVTATCRTCGQALAPGSAICQRCGAAHGAANRCPHCDVVADVEPHAALGFRCLVCGGPRVALDLQGVAPSARTNDALRSAAKEQLQQSMLAAAGFALAGMGALSLLVATVAVLATGPSALLTVAAYVASVVPLATGVFALTKAARARKLRTEALLRARVSALGDVQAVTGLLAVERVSAVLRISPEAAELLLAEASVASYLNEAPQPRARVAQAELGAEAAELDLPAEAAPARTRSAATRPGETES
jgi:hypothetical protein